MAGSGVNVTRTTNQSVEVDVPLRFRSATECLLYLGPSAYQLTSSTQGTITTEHDRSQEFAKGDLVWGTDLPAGAKGRAQVGPEGEAPRNWNQKWM